METSCRERKSSNSDRSSASSDGNVFSRELMSETFCVDVSSLYKIGDVQLLLHPRGVEGSPPTSRRLWQPEQKV